MTRMNLVIQYLRFQLFWEKLYRPLRMLCRCLPWMILPWMILLWMILPLDACSSVSFPVKCAMQIRRNCGDVYTHLSSSKAVFDFAFTKMQWANVCNFRQFEFRSNISLNLLQPLSLKVWIFRKIEEADSLFPLARAISAFWKTHSCKLRPSLREDQAGVIHAISPIWMKLCQIEGTTKQL